jgi:hypothetical protein
MVDDSRAESVALQELLKATRAQCKELERQLYVRHHSVFKSSGHHLLSPACACKLHHLGRVTFRQTVIGWNNGRLQERAGSCVALAITLNDYRTISWGGEQPVKRGPQLAGTGAG